MDERNDNDHLDEKIDETDYGDHILDEDLMEDCNITGLDEGDAPERTAK